MENADGMCKMHVVGSKPEYEDQTNYKMFAKFIKERDEN